MRLFLFFLFFLCNLSVNLAVKTIEFDKNHLESTLSSAILANNPLLKLPEHFILCSSHYQSHINTKNTRTIYVLYQDENMTIPWLNIGIWQEKRLWANVHHESWHRLGNLDSQDLFEWIHICLEINLVKEAMSANINGKQFGFTKVAGLNPSVDLGFNIRLGIVHHSTPDTKEQFYGKLANIQLLRPIDDGIANLMNSLCINKPNISILSWSDMKWTFSGNDSRELEIDSSLICPTSPYADLKVPLKWTKYRAADICSKLGNGKITSFSINTNGNQDNFENECDRYWTPYVYSLTKGIVRNENTDVEDEVLWWPGYPANITDWSGIIYYQERKLFLNSPTDSAECLICNTSLKTIYTMRGNCKYSLLGNLKYSAYMNNKYMGFFGEGVIIR